MTFFTDSPFEKMMIQCVLSLSGASPLCGLLSETVKREKIYGSRTIGK